MGRLVILGMLLGVALTTACEAGEGPRSAGAAVPERTLYLVPGDVVDKSGPSRWGAGVPNIRSDLMGKRVVLRGVHFVLGGEWHTDMACGMDENDMSDCCNDCSSLAHLSELGEIPVYDPDRHAVGCGGNCCKPRVCPDWFPKEDESLDLVGSFENGVGFELSMFFLLRELPRTRTSRKTP